MKWPSKTQLVFERTRLVKELNALYQNRLICSSIIREYENQLNIINLILNMYEERSIRLRCE